MFLLFDRVLKAQSDHRSRHEGENFVISQVDKNIPKESARFGDGDVSYFCTSDPLLYVAAGELGSLLLHGEVQSGRQRPPSRLAEEAHPAGARGEPVQTPAGPSQGCTRCNQVRNLFSPVKCQYPLALVFYNLKPHFHVFLGDGGF